MLFEYPRGGSAVLVVECFLYVRVRWAPIDL